MEGSKCIVGIILRPQIVSFVERFIILCPYLGESTTGGFTVFSVLDIMIIPSYEPSEMKVHQHVK